MKHEQDIIARVFDDVNYPHEQKYCSLKQIYLILSLSIKSLLSQ